MQSRCGYDLFIEGETVDLVIPNELAIERDGWHSWFNDRKICRHLTHGVFPNTRANQKAFLETAQSGRSRLLLLVVPKDADHATGVVSLSEINMQARSATFGMVLSSDAPTTVDRMFFGIEAKARIVEHGFEEMGLERIYGGQSFELEGWQRYQLLFGFLPEGYSREAFRKGHRTFDVIQTACLYANYRKIMEKRGAYWPGKKTMLRYIKSQRDNDYLERFREMVVEFGKKEFGATLDLM